MMNWIFCTIWLPDSCGRVLNRSNKAADKALGLGLSPPSRLSPTRNGLDRGPSLSASLFWFTTQKVSRPSSSNT